jgi:hypothetical protein
MTNIVIIPIADFERCSPCICLFRINSLEDRCVYKFKYINEPYNYKKEFFNKFDSNTLSYDELIVWYCQVPKVVSEYLIKILHKQLAQYKVSGFCNHYLIEDCNIGMELRRINDISTKFVNVLLSQ